MDVQKKLDEIVTAVGSARSMPMSASCVVNRAELLALLEEVREALPGSLAQAEELIGGREQVVAQARQEAERIIETAHAERGSLISDTEVARRSQNEAERIVSEARQEADEIRAEADDYVDSKLANFEVVLTKTLGSVGRGREKLLGTGQGLDPQGYEDPDYAEAPERSHDPETLRQRADEYVDVKLGAFEAVLAKTLDAVGRGRQKLQGRVVTDELGSLGDAGVHTSDADYLADLAEMSDRPDARRSQPRPEPAAEQPAAPPVPDQQPYAPQDPYTYQQQDPYAYQQQAYGQQQDPYAYQDPYGYQQQAYDPAQTYDPAQAQAQVQAQGYGQQQPASAAALDETSLFDTSMISAEQLRQYEQGR
ncbi:cell division initiation protein [Streptomyces sp. NPDC091292]|uniref:ATP synthase F0 subunit B n=1 Tax=Streptomyces sp. NPDC091292 TaxID=3365991 RepID=UPI003815A84D